MGSAVVAEGAHTTKNSNTDTRLPGSLLPFAQVSWLWYIEQNPFFLQPLILGKMKSTNICEGVRKLRKFELLSTLAITSISSKTTGYFPSYL